MEFQLKISFGGIPNSSSLMPGLTTWAHSCSAVVLPMHNVITKRCSKTITWLLLSRLQGNKPHSRELSGTFRNLPPEPTPAHTGTLRNLPEPASGTYTNTHRNPPEPSGTCLWNLPAHPGTLRNLLEPSSGTGSFDPHRHTPELIWAEDPISLRCWELIWAEHPISLRCWGAYLGWRPH